MKTLEEKMYISNGYDPLHIYSGWGIGLNYHPYLPISGGTINEKEPEKIKELMETNDINNLNRVLRAYEKGKVNILSPDYDEEEREKDLPFINKVIDSINRKISRIDTDEEEEEGSDVEEEFIDLLNNFDNLNERQLIDLGVIVDRLDVEKKLSDEEVEDITNRIIEREIQMKNIKPIMRKELGGKYTNEIEYKLNLDDNGNIITTIIKGTTDKFLNDLMDEFVKDEDNVGEFGKRLEHSYVKALDKEGKKSINNDKHPFYSKYLTKGIDTRTGKLKPLSDYLPYDIVNITNKSNDELKAYIDPKTQNGMEKIKEATGIDGVYLQLSKFKGPRFHPFFNNDGGEVGKLKNIYDSYYSSKPTTAGEFKNKFVNSVENVDLYMKYLLPDGLYELKLNDSNLFDFNLEDIVEYNKVWNKNKNMYEAVSIKQKIVPDVFVFDIEENKKKFNVVKDGKGQESLWIDKKYLKKIS